MDIQTHLARVAHLQNEMGYRNFIEEERWNYFREIAFSLIKEVAEVLDEVPWKPWESIEAQKLDKEAAAKEICDIFVFAFVLWITLDSDKCLEDTLQETYDKVLNRIKTKNYGKQEKNV